MSEAFIVRRGGGGTGKFFACISVTYDADGVCTCTDGSKTFTADGVNGKYVFHVPYAGEWTITSVSPSRTLTKTVTVENQYDAIIVNLKRFYLYHDGEQVVTWGRTNSSQRFEDTYAYIIGASGAGGGISSDPFRVEHFTHLCIEYTNLTASSGRFLRNSGLYTENNQATNYIVTLDNPPTGERRVEKIPIAGLTGSFKVGLYTNTSSSSRGNIYNVWFE